MHGFCKFCLKYMLSFSKVAVQTQQLLSLVILETMVQCIRHCLLCIVVSIKTTDHIYLYSPNVGNITQTVPT